MLRTAAFLAMVFFLGGCAQGLATISRLEDADIATAEPLEGRNSSSLLFKHDDKEELQDLRSHYAQAKTAAFGGNSVTAAMAEIQKAASDRLIAYGRWQETKAAAQGKPSGSEEDKAQHTAEQDYASAIQKEQDSEQNYAQARSKAESMSSGENAAATERYFKSGIALSDVLCDRWLARLYRSNVAIQQTNDFLANTGATTSTLLPLVDAATYTTAGIASGLNWLRQGTADTGKNYIISPDLGHVQRMLANYRTDFYTSKSKSEEIKDPFRVASLLSSYHATCSGAFVRSLINRSIDQTLPPEEADPLELALLTTAAEHLNAKFFEEANVKAEDVPYIFAASRLGGTADFIAVQDKVEAYLDNHQLLIGRSPSFGFKLKQGVALDQLQAWLDLFDDANVARLRGSAQRLLVKLAGKEKAKSPAEAKRYQ